MNLTERGAQCDGKVLRAELIRGIREFFWSNGFIETDTPSLVLSPGMEPHIRPIQIHQLNTYLPTSPEFAMKRLLAKGYPKIFQICKAYRHEPMSTTHNPEFTILEWYRAQSGFEEIMDDVENLFVALSRSLHGARAKEVERPWPRYTVERCFREFAGLELSQLQKTADLARVCAQRGWCSSSGTAVDNVDRPGAWDDFFFLVMMNAVEPALARLGKPVIVHHYPESQAALSNIVTDDRGLRWAKRFEVYAGGLELGNAFDELTDPVEQRWRFEKDMRLRRAIYGEGFKANPIDEDFLAALAHLPPSGGIAMGVDRMAMYFAGAEDIKEVLWGEPHWPANQ